MTERAKVTSVEALEAFRADLIVYLSKARPALEEMGDEARQTRAWLENDRRPHWLQELRRRGRELDEAKQALFSAKLSNLGEPTAAHHMAVTRAQRALREAEDKVRLIQKWCREFENLTAPLTKQLDQVHWMVTTDMKRAAAYLAEVVRILDSYAHVAAPSAAGSAARPGGPDEADASLGGLGTVASVPPEVAAVKPVPGDPA
jgi:hypothetical protein